MYLIISKLFFFVCLFFWHDMIWSSFTVFGLCMCWRFCDNHWIMICWLFQISSCPILPHYKDQQYLAKYLINQSTIPSTQTALSSLPSKSGHVTDCVLTNAIWSDLIQTTKFLASVFHSTIKTIAYCYIILSSLSFFHFGFSFTHR